MEQHIARLNRFFELMSFWVHQARLARGSGLPWEDAQACAHMWGDIYVLEASLFQAERPRDV